ncbi:MAG: SIS domain-containing protein [Deltaproteobacteria bacterium]|nr:SIS domain-containing protein [Deltaproteobacteria bacterium]
MKTIPELIHESIDTKKKLLDSPEILTLIGEIAESAISVLRNGGKLIFAGNGGSFADALHLSAEFISRFKKDRAPLASIALGCNNSAVTAIGNDYDYSDSLVRELQALGQKKDLFIAISTSGNSKNILKCIDEAKKIGMTVYGWTGNKKGKISEMTRCLEIPSAETARIQECHIMVGHILCEMIDNTLFS